jgi:hypothetical protein
MMGNHERPSKRHLLPFALAFRDDPSTRPGKHRDRPSALAVFSNHPSVAPHVHSVASQALISCCGSSSGAFQNAMIASPMYLTSSICLSVKGRTSWR